MTVRHLCLLICITISPALAADFKPGDSLPPLEIQDRGELIINGDDIDFRQWSSTELDFSDRVQIVQYLAARPSSQQQIEPFTDALEAADFPDELHLVTSVVNLDDVTLGASGWALSELKVNKRKYPETSLVADWNGKGLKTWGLRPKSTALFVLDDKGQLLFFKEGPLTDGEVTQVINLIRHQLARRGAS